ncbi:mechanosensitive ion channel family protein [Paraburkholderia caballeronis]|uniref:Mechanosensitive ion channel n=1 Tax=Paraburkholderia caballeronis TaxID=416943 RepID=A0A1H7PKA1_9BURK|nr:mechanosensitive ion channel domain-containing protein [Paraburkholderia caballeronis]PXW24198.1 mechanosensitive ion channel-like protein [Paraburkholderia caballeronis]PXW99979.1 mechanosensitive ion channel-like protein [Paraburkholderia caballeronis]RAJ97109.1 mechanosensitive ion channel-like protein [Paraburkholderia caballeronis]TDV08248.1 mechanosensitive ion channel-like protein [Paraburkholderia caballeronis]TDV11940.1 mechanosensitive ion channel-like protein [Paraburkholderia ca
MENRLLSHMLGGVVRDYGQPVMLWQAAVLIGTLVLAWFAARFVRRALDARRQARHEGRPHFGAESLNKAFFPLIGAVFVWLARDIARSFIHTWLLDLALVPLFGIGLIYIVFYLARRVFGRSGQTRAWLSLVERVVSLVVWVGMVLTVLGIQDDVLAWMESVRVRIGTVHVTLLSLANGLLWVCVTMVVATWAGGALEDRLMRATTLDANLRVVLARVGRALLMLAAVLVSLSLVGIDITVLGVFGGALGVGLGFGLQKIASNYVSGFIILLDRSLHLGDSINVSGLQGKVTQIRTRYTVVRGLDGIETLIPNEKLITDVVQNQSSFLTRGYAKAAVQVAYTSDLELAMKLLAQAAEGVDRVLADPPPTPYLAGFGADGINLELGFWIADAANGTAGVRSAVNLNIWRLYGEHGISIPFAQREVRIIGADGGDAILPGGPATVAMAVGAAPVKEPPANDAPGTAAA